MGAFVYSNTMFYILVISLTLSISYNVFGNSYKEFNGGVPGKGGSCFCGSYDNYCLCTPSLAIDAIILSPKYEVLLVQRRDNGKKALPGGFVDVWESVENAVLREIHEETGIKIKEDNIEQYRVYSDPTRDRRRHTVSSVFVVKLNHIDFYNAHAGDDAKALVRMPLKEAAMSPLSFDHQKILNDYVAEIDNNTEGSFAKDDDKSKNKNTRENKSSNVRVRGLSNDDDIR